MTKRVISRYEHETLKISDEIGFGESELKLLQKFAGDKGDDFPFFTLINKGVRFKQFVGVLCVGDLQIEVLPKADKNAGDTDKDVWHDHLLAMLKAVYKIKVEVPTNANQNLIRSNSILDVFIQRFLDEIENILHIGLVKTYRQIEGNLNALKGKLLIAKQITKNLIHKERFFDRYTTYDRNHICNRILCKALKTIPQITCNVSIRCRAKTLLFEFPDLEDIIIDESLFKKISLDRKTEYYKVGIDLARLILLHYMPDFKNGNHDKVLALMFDMNKLWEEYVYVMLRRNMKEYFVTAQNRKTFWSSACAGEKNIRPDIVVRDSESCLAVLDTKWKCPKEEKPSDDDLKQMFVYHNYWETAKTVLIYPGTTCKIIDGTFHQNVERNGSEVSLQCSMLYLPISNVNNWKKYVLSIIEN